MQVRSLIHEKAELIGLREKSANVTKGLDRSEVVAISDVSTAEGVIQSLAFCLLNRLLSTVHYWKTTTQVQLCSGFKNYYFIQYIKQFCSVVLAVYQISVPQCINKGFQLFYLFGTLLYCYFNIGTLFYSSTVSV